MKSPGKLVACLFSPFFTFFSGEGGGGEVIFTLPFPNQNQVKEGSVKSSRSEKGQLQRRKNILVDCSVGKEGEYLSC